MGQKADARRLVRESLLFFFIFAVLLEIGLRIYNPFHFRLKGDKILLPANQREIITNRINPKLDSLIINTRNSLGFRGPEPPRDWGHYLTVITIGGSVTECHFLSDDKTWPFLLSRDLADSFRDCWLNNAGLDGHSTYGHMILLNDYVKKLKPSVVLFLTGINEVETTGPLFHDKLSTRSAYTDLRHFIVNNSEVLSLVLNLAREEHGQKFNNTTDDLLVLDSARRLDLPDTVIRKRLAEQAPYLLAYQQRLSALADTCLAWHILPVFITQPNLFGEGRDPATGADLEAYPTDPKDAEINGKLIWEILEQYNEVVRSLGRERRLGVIDLARQMPKNSLYYYDMSHFTNEGAHKASGLIATALCPMLRLHFPEYYH